MEGNRGSGRKLGDDPEPIKSISVPSTEANSKARFYTEDVETAKAA